MQYKLAKISDDSDEKMLNPRFKKRFQGYDPAEVDVLIDNWQKKITALSEQNVQQAMKLQAASRFVAEMKAKSTKDARLLTLVMATAEKAAEKIIAEAKAEADELKYDANNALVTARVTAKQMIENAESETAKLRAAIDMETEQAYAALQDETVRLQGMVNQKLSDAKTVFAQLSAASDNLRNLLDGVDNETNKALAEIKYALPAIDGFSGEVSVLEMRREVIRLTNVQKIPK